MEKTKYKKEYDREVYESDDGIHWTKIEKEEKDE